MTISLLDVLDTPHAILHTHGEVFYGAILPHIRNNDSIQIDMTGIQSLTSNFLARSIGRLCNEFEEAAGLIEFTNYENTFFPELIGRFI